MWEVFLRLLIQSRTLISSSYESVYSGFTRTVHITNTYGGGISCQGPTMNFTPYVTHSISEKDPFEQRYFEPQYDARDFEGRTVQVQKIVKNFPWEEWYDDRTYTNSEGEEVRAYEDGADMPIIVDEIQPDGVPDNPEASPVGKTGENRRKTKL